MPNFQFGFRANHSTTHQLHRVADTISTTLETKKYCAGVFLDVAKPFDTVWHEGLLFKLKTLFPAPYYLLLKSYLGNRTFNVRHNLQHSKQFPIAAGVLQGSHIAPFLYIIYTSDLPTSDKHPLELTQTILRFYLQLLIILPQAFNYNHTLILFLKLKSTNLSLPLSHLHSGPITINNTIIPHSN